MKFGSTSAITASGIRTVMKARAPCRLKSCSWWRRPPDSSARPTTPFKTIIKPAKSVSRASSGFASPVTMIAEIRLTSMVTTEKVRTRVP